MQSTIMITERHGIIQATAYAAKELIRAEIVGVLATHIVRFSQLFLVDEIVGSILKPGALNAQVESAGGQAL